MLVLGFRYWFNRKLSKKQAYVRHLATELEDITDSYQKKADYYIKNKERELHDFVENIQKEVKLDLEAIEYALNTIKELYDDYKSLIDITIENFKVNLEIQLVSKYITIIKSSIDLIDEEIKTSEKLLNNYHNLAGYKERLIYLGNLNSEFTQMEALSLNEFKKYLSLTYRINRLDDEDSTEDYKHRSLWKIQLRLKNDLKVRFKIKELEQKEQLLQKQKRDLINQLINKQNGEYSKHKELCETRRSLLKEYNYFFSNYKNNFHSAFPDYKGISELKNQKRQLNTSVYELINYQKSLIKEVRYFKNQKKLCHDLEDYTDFDFYKSKIQEISEEINQANKSISTTKTSIAPKIERFDREILMRELLKKALTKLHPNVIKEFFSMLKDLHDEYADFKYTRLRTKK